MGIFAFANERDPVMKTLNICLSMPFAAAALMLSCLASSGAEAPRPSRTAPLPVSAAENPVNYILRADWKSNNGATNTIQLLTTEGTFKVNTSQPSAVKVGDSELSISVSLDGTLKAVSSQQGQLQLFLGRSVPYVTHGGGPPGSSSIQQRQEGLTLTFLVTFGQPVLVQKDGNGEVSILVERQNR